MAPQDIASTATDAHGRDDIEDKKDDLNIDIEKQVQTSIRAAEREEADLQHITSHITNHDIPNITSTFHDDNDSEIYDKFPKSKKYAITAVMSLCSFLAPMSSTTVLSALPEVAKTYDSNGSIIGLTNALYMLFMGVSPLFWGPMGQVYGRRWPCIYSALLFFAFSIGTALAPNLASFFIFRILTAFQGTSFLILGASVIGDIFRPTERATAISWFYSGTLIGPAFGPFIGGIIVTFHTWRDIFWLQTALAGLSMILVFLLVPETTHFKRSIELQNLSKPQKALKLWNWINPSRVVALYRYPNLFLVSVCSASLVWNMYSLLTPIRYVLNPRFGLTSPLQSGLFYIAPGCGYLFGTFFGGRWADHIVKRYMRKRGRRVPEDRLRSCLLFVGIIIPACILLYGWSIEKEVGGIPLPTIVLFLQGVAQLFCFPSLNTYCLDVMQGRSSEVIAGNYMFRYLFACLGTAVVLPIIDRVGVGWFSTISAGFLVLGALSAWATVIWGEKWRTSMDSRKGRKKRGSGEAVGKKDIGETEKEKEVKG